mgnify:CR=1 FL=1
MLNESVNVEIRTTKEGIQYRLIYNDMEISGSTTSRSKSVVEKIIERIINVANEAPPEVSIVADKLTDYITSIVAQFNVDHVSSGASIKAGEAKVSLYVYLTYYVDEKVEEWRGYVEAAAECRDGKKSSGKHLVKRRIVADTVSGFSLYRELMNAARHAYNACVAE